MCKIYYIKCENKKDGSIRYLLSIENKIPTDNSEIYYLEVPGTDQCEVMSLETLTAEYNIII